MHVMQSTEPPPTSVPIDPLRDLGPDHLRRFTRAEYERMAELGFFLPEERVELLRGVVVRVSPQGPLHSDVVDRLNRILQRGLDEQARLRCQGPFAAGDDSEPEPDLAVYPEQDYSREHPTQALLLIEVSDSSLRKDRGIKREIYAEVGVPEYWVVDVQARTVEVYTQPGSAGYGRLVTYDRAQVISPEAFPELAVRLADVLPA